MPDVLKLEVDLDRPVVPAEAMAAPKLRLRVQSVPGLVIPPAKAMTSNICLVFDCSGSMAGKKRDAAIEAAKLIVDTISERHRLSLVGFATKAKVIVDNVQPSREGKEAVKAKIDKQIRAFPRGTTNLAAGLDKATAALSKHAADARVMIILSDGGADSEKKARIEGAAATAARIQLFAVGIGDDYDAEALLALVTPSGGAMFGESDADRIKATFEMLIGRIDSFVATNARLELAFAEGIKPGTAYKVAPDQAVIGKVVPDAKRVAKLSLGNVEKDQPYAFIVTAVTPSRGPGRLDVAKAALVFDVPSLKLREQRVEVPVTLEYARAGGEPNADVEAAFRAVQFVELVGNLAAAQRRGDLEASIEALRQLIRRAQELGDEDAKVFYADVLDELKERGKISQDRLNALLIGSTNLLRKKKQGPRLYDVVLVEAGKGLITVIRELRRITGRELHEVSMLVKAAPHRIKTLPLADARALKKELQGYGARVDVKPRMD